MEPIKDMIYNIMLHLDLEETQLLCTLNKKTSDICKDEQFWLDKYKLYNYPPPRCEKTR